MFNLSLIYRGKLNDMQYTSNQEVINDIKLVFSNCYSVSIVINPFFMMGAGFPCAGNSIKIVHSFYSFPNLVFCF